MGCWVVSVYHCGNKVQVPKRLVLLPLWEQGSGPEKVGVALIGGLTSLPAHPTDELSDSWMQCDSLWPRC